MKPLKLSLIALVLITLVGYTQLTIFVVQPIGAIPDGLTILVWRREKTKFIDSVDAVCAREMGGVSLLCRVGVLAGIAGKEADGILLRMPYSKTLYLLSTGGLRYGK